MYKIISVSKYGKEQVDECSTIKEARYLVKEYRIAFGVGFSIYIMKGRKVLN
jgi:hypothetical protein